MDSRAKELVKIGDGLFSKKGQWDTLCQDVAENIYPLRSDFTSPFTLGEDFSTGLMESYPVLARQTLGDSISSMLRQGNWFECKTGFEDVDDDPTNARWLEEATVRFRRNIYDRRSNFVRSMSECDHDWVSFGNSIVSVETNNENTHLLFRSWHPKSCAWIENDEGKIDHIQRNMPMTARAMKARGAWGGKLHSDIVQAAEKEPTREFKVRHIVLPFEEIYGSDKGKRAEYKGRPFCSIYIDCEHETVLSEAPLNVFSYVVPRWKTISGFPQGFSPVALNALPDARMIQCLSRIVLEQGEKALDPPMIGKGDIFRDAINIYSGGMTMVDLENDDDIRKVFQTIESSGNTGVGMEMKQDVRNMIAEAFLLNKLMLPSAREMTAFETQARLDEFRRAALPFFGPIESEYHLPVLDVAFQICVHNQAFNFKEMPEALGDADITFTFESPLNTAEGRQNVQAFQESVQILAGAAQFDQSIPTLMDFKKMTKDAVKGTQAKADWFNDEETQQSDEEAANSAAKLQEMAATLQQGAGVASDVATATQQLQAAGMV